MLLEIIFLKLFQNQRDFTTKIHFFYIDKIKIKKQHNRSHAVKIYLQNFSKFFNKKLKNFYKNTKIIFKYKNIVMPILIR